MRATRLCTIDSCGEKHHSRGYCSRHYGHYRHHGDPLASSGCHATPEERFTRFYVIDGASGCWLWTGKILHDGYGVFTVSRGVQPVAHRFSYEMLVGPIPVGLQLDHLCRVRNCVNPEHLEPVTSRENTLRGYGPSAMNAKKAHCRRGHPFTQANTRVTDGARVCRTCERLRSRERSSAVGGAA